MSSSDTQTLADVVRQRRDQLGLTQEQAASEAGMALATWRRLESDDGPDRPRRDTVEKLLRGLAVPPRMWDRGDPATAIAAAMRHYVSDRAHRPWMTRQWLDVLVERWDAEESLLTPRQAVSMTATIENEQAMFLGSGPSERDWTMSTLFIQMPPWIQIAVHDSTRWWQLTEGCVDRIHAWLYGAGEFRAELLGEEIVLDLLIDAAEEYHITWTDELAAEEVRTLPVRDGDTDYALLSDVLFDDRDFELAWTRPCEADSPFHPRNWWG